MLRRSFIIGLLSSCFFLGFTRCTLAQDKYNEAYRIMGDDFVYPENVEQFQNQKFNLKQLHDLEMFLPHPEGLKWLKENGYTLMPGPAEPLSLMDIRTRLQPRRFYLSDTRNWYFDEKFFTEDKVEFGWMAIKKDPLPDSLNKTWNEQFALVNQNMEYIPNVAEMAWFMTTLAAVRGVRPLVNSTVLVDSIVTNHYNTGHVSIGQFDPYWGIVITYELDSTKSNYRGLTVGALIG